jgi:cytochrome c oxidase subunit III
LAEAHLAEKQGAEKHGAEKHGALAHHFDDLDQQQNAAELGMWLFLATEVLFFGALFLAYTLYRLQNEQAFANASAGLNLWLGTINTVVLLTSSLTMALAVHAAQLAHRQMLIRMLLATMVLGTAFIVIKGVEWHEDYAEDMIPFLTSHFHLKHGPNPPAPASALFFNLYFLMTGLHAVHMLIGLGVMIYFTAKARRGLMEGVRATPIHLLGLYWHFVDIVWVFLYPFLYLIGASEHGL